MTSIRAFVLAQSALLAFAGLTASAGVAPSTFRFDLTEAPLGFFGQVWSQDSLVPVADIRDMQIVETRVHLEFNTTSVIDFHDAAAFLLQFQPPTINVPVIDFLGADMGWSGLGIFTADVISTAANEPILDFPPDAEFSLWFMRVVSADDRNPFLGGELTGSFIEVDLVPVPEPSTIGLVALGGLAFLRRSRRGAQSSARRRSSATSM